MKDNLEVIQASSGLSDTVWLALITGLVTIATLIIKGVVESHAKKSERIAAAEALKVSQKLEHVELKIDGRLTELLEITKKEAQERGHREGKQEEKQEATERKHEATPATPAAIHDDSPVKLTITEGEIKVVPETTKKKK